MLFSPLVVKLESVGKHTMLRAAWKMRVSSRFVGWFF